MNKGRGPMRRVQRVTAIVAMALPAPAAANKVALSSAVFVEKDVVDSRGRRSIVLEPPEEVSRGDRLVFLLHYRTAGPSAPFMVTNPLPDTVSYQGSPDARAIVSVDGGRHWGVLGALQVRERDGSRRGARPEDVTHVRWTLRRAGSSGKLMFRGVAR